MNRLKFSDWSHKRILSHVLENICKVNKFVLLKSSWTFGWKMEWISLWLNNSGKSYYLARRRFQ